MLQPWRDRVLTTLLIVAVAVPAGIVVGGGLDAGGPDEEVLGVVATTAGAGAGTTTAPTAPTASSSTTTGPSTTVAPRPVGEVRVRFYNGSRRAGAAVTVGQRLKAIGYTVLEPGPSPADPVPATVVAHREGFAGEAAAVARALGLDPTVAKPMPPVPALSGIGDADVVVIVAEDAIGPP